MAALFQSIAALLRLSGVCVYLKVCLIAPRADMPDGPLRGEFISVSQAKKKQAELEVAPAKDKVAEGRMRGRGKGLWATCEPASSQHQASLSETSQILPSPQAEEVHSCVDVRMPYGNGARGGTRGHKEQLA